MDAFKKMLEKLLKGGQNKSLGEKKTLVNLVILLLVGILMVITVSFFKTSPSSGVQGATSEANKKNNNSAQQTSSIEKSDDSYETQVQEKLKSTLEKIEGVGKVEVMVNFESGEEQVPAVNVNDATNTTQEKDTEGGVRNSTQKNNGSTVVITNDGSKSEPLIVKKYKPKVSGVCVVAEGAENKVTQLRIAKAVVNLFSISEGKVNVYPMKK